MQVLERIQELMDQRDWSQYRLRQETGLPQSTISNIFQRISTPTIPTLEIMCDAFGISLCQFFSVGEPFPLTEEQRLLLERWATLNARQKEAIMTLIEENKP